MIKLLKEWDGNASADSIEAGIYLVYCDTLLRNLLSTKVHKEVRFFKQGFSHFLACEYNYGMWLQCKIRCNL